jgi:predicted Zn-dependent protease
VDPRVTISHSIKDPELGVIPVAGVRDITIIEKGVLTELFTDRQLVLNESNVHKPNIERNSYRMEGGTSTTEDLIASTKRGILVTRLSNMSQGDVGSLHASGVTRDGLWLIEDGKIAKPVRNFRFIESPLFALNNLEDIGQAERVFHPLRGSMFVGFTPHMILSQVIVPSIKVRDFSFTSTADAI